MTYQIVRGYRDHPEKRRVIKRGLSLEEAQAHCSDPETSSSTCTSAAGKRRTERFGPWFDGYDEEPTKSRRAGGSHGVGHSR